MTQIGGRHFVFQITSTSDIILHLKEALYLQWLWPTAVPPMLPIHMNARSIRAFMCSQLGEGN